MAFECDQCRKRTSGRAVTTMTGRQVCARCDRQTQAAAAGAVMGAETGTGAVPTAIASAGWRDRVRRAVRGDQQK